MAAAERMQIELSAEDNTAAAFKALRDNADKAAAAIKALNAVASTASGGGLSGMMSALSMLRGFAGPLIVVGTLTAIGAAGYAALKSLRQLGEAADDLGIKASGLDAFGSMLKKAGGSAGDAVDALRHVRDAFDEITQGSRVASVKELFELNKVKMPTEWLDVLRSGAGLIRNAAHESDRLYIATLLVGEKAAPAFVKAVMESNDALQKYIDMLKNAQAPLDAVTAAIKAAGGEWELFGIAMLEIWLAAAKVVRAFKIPIPIDDNAIREAEDRLRGWLNRVRALVGEVGTVGKLSGNPTQTRKKADDSEAAKDAFDREIDRASRHIALMEADALAVDKTAGEHEKLRTQMVLNEAAQRAGIPVTGETAEKFDKMAARARAAADALAYFKLQSDLAFERMQLFRDPIEQQIYQKLRAARIDADSAAGQLLAQEIRLNEQLKLTSDIGKDALKGFISDLMAGKSAAEALHNAIGRIANKLMDMAVEQLWAKAFGGVMGGLFGLGGGVTPTGMTFASGSFGAMGGVPFQIIGAGAGHAGAIIGDGGLKRLVHPAYFEDAPRYHSGGLLAPDEVPFIGQRGEEIGWPDDLARKYGGPNVTVVQHNTFHGADPGSEARLRAALAVTKAQAVNEAVAAVAKTRANAPFYLAS